MAAPRESTPEGKGQTVLIAGASGMIGTELAKQLTQAGHTAVRLVRHPTHHPLERQWDPEGGWLNVATVEAADAIVNLSGASLSRLPWTLPYKKQILASRLQATATITEAIARAQNPPATLVSAAAVGFYGDRPGEDLTEQSDQGSGFLAKVVDSWERAAMKASAQTRVVTLRTGLVLGKGGGLRPFELMTKLGAGGPLGGGQQYWSWISLHDEAAAIVHLIASSGLRGPVNLTGPNPVPAAELSRVLAERLHRPYWLTLPRWAISATLADAGRELLLSDQKVSSQLLAADGFTFTHKTVAEGIDAALAA